MKNTINGQQSDLRLQKVVESEAILPVIIRKQLKNKMAKLVLVAFIVSVFVLVIVVVVVATLNFIKKII